METITQALLLLMGVLANWMAFLFIITSVDHDYSRQGFWLVKVPAYVFIAVEIAAFIIINLR